MGKKWKNTLPTLGNVRPVKMSTLTHKSVNKSYFCHVSSIAPWLINVESCVQINPYVVVRIIVCHMSKQRSSLQVQRNCRWAPSNNKSWKLPQVFTTLSQRCKDTSSASGYVTECNRVSCLHVNNIIFLCLKALRLMWLLEWPWYTL